MPAKLDPTTGNIPEEALDDFDAQLVLADLLYRPGKEAAHQQALERLAKQDPAAGTARRARPSGAGRRGETTRLYSNSARLSNWETGTENFFGITGAY